MSIDRELFDTELLKKLEYLALVSQRLHRGRARGEHITYRKGSSLEFFDYRSYQPGDDFRYIDWNIYSRLDRLVVKLFAAEEDLSVHILLDASKSMEHGDPAKIAYARRVAAALAYIGISHLDRVGLTLFSSKLGQTLPAHRSRKQLFSLFEAFSRIKCEGKTSLNLVLEEFARRTRQPGLAIIISDLLDPEGCETGLAALAHRGHDIVVMQILDDSELAPPDSGEFELQDTETGEILSISVNKSIAELYGNTLLRWFRGIEDYCLNRGIEYLRISTAIPFEDLILKYLRQGLHLH